MKKAVFLVLIMAILIPTNSLATEVLAGGWWNASMEDLQVARNKISMVLGESITSYGAGENGSTYILLDGWTSATEQEMHMAKAQLDGQIKNMGGELPATPTPTPTPTSTPTLTPTAEPTPKPTKKPTPKPTKKPTPTPIPEPEVFTLEDGITFEMPMSNVLSRSVRDLHKAGKTDLICNTSVFGIDTTMALAFGKKDALYKVECWLRPEGKGAEQYYSEFQDVSEALTFRYGEATVSGEKWTSESDYKKYASDMINALNKGKMMSIEVWSFSDVYIEHTVGNTKSGIHHFLTYRSPTLDPDIDKIRELYWGY